MNKKYFKNNCYYPHKHLLIKKNISNPIQELEKQHRFLNYLVIFYLFKRHSFNFFLKKKHQY